MQISTLRLATGAIIAAITVGLIGIFFGYLLFRSTDSDATTLQSYKAKVEQLEAELEKIKASGGENPQQAQELNEKQKIIDNQTAELTSLRLKVDELKAQLNNETGKLNVEIERSREKINQVLKESMRSNEKLDIAQFKHNEELVKQKGITAARDDHIRELLLEKGELENKLKEVASTNMNVDQLQETLNELNEVKRISKELENAKLKQDQQLDQLQRSIVEKNNEIAILKADKENLIQQNPNPVLNTVAVELQKKIVEAVELQKKMDLLNKGLENANKEITGLVETKSRLEKELSHQDEIIKEQKDEISKFQLVKELNGELDEMKTKTQQLAAENTKQIEKFVESQATQLKQQKKIERLNSEREQLTKSLLSSKAESDQLMNDLTKLKNDLSVTEAKIDQLEIIKLGMIGEMVKLKKTIEKQAEYIKRLEKAWQSETLSLTTTETNDSTSPAKRISDLVEENDVIPDLVEENDVISDLVEENKEIVENQQCTAKVLKPGENPLQPKHLTANIETKADPNIPSPRFFNLNECEDSFKKFRSFYFRDLLKDIQKVFDKNSVLKKNNVSQNEVVDLILLSIYCKHEAIAVEKLQNSLPFNSILQETYWGNLDSGFQSFNYIFIVDVRLLYIPFKAMRFFKNLRELTLVRCGLTNELLNDGRFEFAARRWLSELISIDFSANCLKKFPIFPPDMEKLTKLNLANNEEMKLEDNMLLGFRVPHHFTVNSNATLNIKNTAITVNDVVQIGIMCKISVDAHRSNLTT